MINGNFAASGGVRKGSGHLSVTTAAARAAGLDPGLGYLDTMTADYDNHAFPITVNLQFTNLPNPLKPDDPTQGTYDFAAARERKRIAVVQLHRQQHSGARRIDVFQVTSNWLGSGPGRSDLQVVSGDAAGAHESPVLEPAVPGGLHRQTLVSVGGSRRSRRPAPSIPSL